MPSGIFPNFPLTLPQGIEIPGYNDRNSKQIQSCGCINRLILSFPALKLSLPRLCKCLLRVCMPSSGYANGSSACASLSSGYASGSFTCASLSSVYANDSFTCASLSSACANGSSTYASLSSACANGLLLVCKPFLRMCK